MSLTLFVACSCGVLVSRGSEPTERARTTSRAERPPRKVVVGTAIYGPYGKYPGLDERLRELCGLVDEMAARAGKQNLVHGLDLALLPETTVTSTRGTATERAIPLRGKVQDTIGALARKHRCYVLLPMDLADDGPNGACCSNAAVLFDRKGEVAGVYRKGHPVAYVNSDALEGGITPGADVPVFQSDFGRLGVQICWDIQFPDGWDALGARGAEIVAWPTASPATVLPAARAAAHRYYVISSTWRDNATVFEPTGMVAAQALPPQRVLVHQLDLSYAILGWSSFLRDGEALREKFGEKVGLHYSTREDMGLFWSNDPSTSIGSMIRSIGGEELDLQVERNGHLHAASRGIRRASRTPTRSQ
jgi:predicted amidohydrolase